jgi:beta-phosphoglucomutase-like phosphatase (HAD superfamily)
LIVDMDGTICDFVGAYEKMTGEVVTHYDHPFQWELCDFSSTLI